MTYLPHTKKDISEMLDIIGVKQVGDLFIDIPKNLKKEIDFFPSQSEIELRKTFNELSNKNMPLTNYVSFLGGGAYEHFIPSVVKHLAGRSEFYTAYTPYQPEVSQGILKVIFEYQTMIANLFDLDISNASLYDGATALAEAMIMACNYTGRNKVAVDPGINPNYIKVLRTYAWGRGIEITDLKLNELDEKNTSINRSIDLISSDDVACYLIPQIDFFGNILDLRGIADKVHEKQSLMVVISDPISLGLIKPPGYFGADVAVGEGQSLGSELSFGGPYLGLLAAREFLLRFMPGRIAGETVDKKGEPGYVLTFQTREQHIRREKATSNICSNEALNALKATIFLSVMGVKGIREIALQSMLKANYMKNKLRKNKFKVLNESYTFKEFALELPCDVELVQKKLLDNKILGGVNLSKFYPYLKNCLLIAMTEMRSKDQIDDFCQRLNE